MTLPASSWFRPRWYLHSSFSHLTKVHFPVQCSIWFFSLYWTNSVTFYSCSIGRRTEFIRYITWVMHKLRVHPAAGVHILMAGCKYLRTCAPGRCILLPTFSTYLYWISPRTYCRFFFAAHAADVCTEYIFNFDHYWPRHVRVRLYCGRLGKFTSISSRQRTINIQNLVVHNYLWSSSSVFLLQNSRKKGKIGIFVVIVTQKSSSHEDDQNSISGRPQLFSGRHWHEDTPVFLACVGYMCIHTRQCEGERSYDNTPSFDIEELKL